MITRKWMAAAVIGAGAALTGPVHAADGTGEKQSVGEYVTDATISTKVRAAFVADKSLSALDIAVETNDGVVTLTGSVATSEQVSHAADVTRGVDGVKQVKNDIKVDPSKAK
ncbi:BON domain-containing protein [Bordetella genomosp. 13]|uniref:BON domain-containing protein n=1 Tax=Bordetella genomosp. 13 TaxID=463040 RepID=UPI0011A15A0E|nr:BON domain-containing protein [Bordetella genomosp. 13]